MMTVNERKYKTFFIEEMSGNLAQYENEYQRVIKENELSEQLKYDFIIGVFESLINFHKKHMSIDKYYYIIIKRYYVTFIQQLKEDNLNYTSIESELTLFTNEETNYNTNNTTTSSYKEYNPNTKYGRRKGIEQARRNYQNGTPEYKAEVNNYKIVLWLIVGIIAIVLYFIKEKLSK